MNPRKTQIFRVVATLVMALGLSACASVETASRNAPTAVPLNTPVEAQGAAPVFVPASVSVTAVNVVVPESLRVSEANRFYPGGDIVWREDPIGDRRQQVATIVRDSLLRGVADMAGARKVTLEVQVTRFHALTQKARYTVGGVHAIQFYLTMLDAETGAIVIPTHLIRADFKALGGAAAIAAERRGRTQKVRITEHLAYVIRQELLTSEGYRAEHTGLVGAINQL